MDEQAEEPDCCGGTWIERGQLMFVHSAECQRPESKAYWEALDHLGVTHG